MGLFVTIIILLVSIVIISIIFKIVKNIIKTLFLFLLIFSVIIGVFGIIALLDARDFSENFQTMPSTILLEEKGTILAGFEGFENPLFISIDNLAEYNEYYMLEDYENILKENYKLFIVPLEWFDPVDDDIFVQILLPKNQMFAFFRSEDPVGEYALILSLVGIDLKTEEKALEVKNRLFANLFSVTLGHRGGTAILDSYRDGKILIYPETMMFKFVKYVPDFMFEKIKEKMVAGEKPTK